MSGDAAQRQPKEQGSGSAFDARAIRWTETTSTIDITFSMSAWAAGDDNGSDTATALTIAELKAQCVVKIRAREVSIASKKAGHTEYLRLPLPGDIDTDDSTYTLAADAEGKAEVELALEKCTEGMWGGV